MRHLDEREIAYIRAAHDLKKALGPTEMADLVHKRFRAKKREKGPGKNAVWNVMRNKTHMKNAKPRTGRPRKTTKEEDKELLRSLKPLQKKYHRKRGAVTARVLKAHWKTVQKVSKRSISRRCVEGGKPWRPVVRKLRISKEDKLEANGFSKKWVRRPKTFFEKNVLYIDNKKWPLYTTEDAKEYSVSQGVKGMYRSAADGVEMALPSKAKHRFGTGYRALNVLGGFGNGKCHFAHVVCKDTVDYETGDTIKSNWCAKEYAKAVRYIIKKAFREDPNLTHLWRDGDPNGFDTNIGRAAEATAGLDVIQQPHRRPGLNPLDYTFHTAVEASLKADTLRLFGDDDDTSETPAAYSKRVRDAYFSLDASSIFRGCADLKKRRLPGVIKAKGGHFAAKYGSD